MHGMVGGSGETLGPLVGGCLYQTFHPGVLFFVDEGILITNAVVLGDFFRVHSMKAMS